MAQILWFILYALEFQVSLLFDMTYFHMHQVMIINVGFKKNRWCHSSTTKNNIEFIRAKQTISCAKCSNEVIDESIYLVKLMEME